ADPGRDDLPRQRPPVLELEVQRVAVLLEGRLFATRAVVVGEDGHLAGARQLPRPAGAKVAAGERGPLLDGAREGRDIARERGALAGPLNVEVALKGEA